MNKLIWYLIGLFSIIGFSIWYQIKESKEETKFNLEATKIGKVPVKVKICYNIVVGRSYIIRHNRDLVVSKVTDLTSNCVFHNITIDKYMFHTENINTREEYNDMIIDTIKIN